MKEKINKMKCLHCKVFFRPDNYNKNSQNYCAKTEACRKESHRASQEKYRKRKNKDPDFRKKEVRRVTKWQKETPDYWKKTKKTKKNNPEIVLRDIARGENDGVYELLRDIVQRQEYILLGVIDHILEFKKDGVLRDIIASPLNALYDKGKQLMSSSISNPKKEEYVYDSQRNYRPEKASDDSGGIRVGRSSPCEGKSHQRV